MTACAEHEVYSLPWIHGPIAVSQPITEATRGNAVVNPRGCLLTTLVSMKYANCLSGF